MEITSLIANNIREVHYNGNWTAENLKDQLTDISWEQATTKIKNLNTIAALVFHINYYIAAVLKVLQGEPLKAHDSESFNLPPIKSQHDWEQLVNKTVEDARVFAAALEKLPDEKMGDVFEDEKYGSYLRNLIGLLQHTYYHLGQIAIVKKLL